MEFKENAHNDLLHQFQKEGVLKIDCITLTRPSSKSWIFTTVKMTIFTLNCDSFVCLFVFGSKINCGYTHNLFLSKKVKKNVFPCLSPSFGI